VEGYIWRLTERLLDRGQEVHVFCSRWEPMSREGLVFHRVPRPAGPPFLRVIGFDRNLGRALSGGEYDVIHGFTKTSRQDVYTDGSGCLRDFEEVSLALRGPVRRLLRRYGPHRYAVARMEALRYREGHFRKVIAMSRMARDQIRHRYGLDDGEVEVVYNGVDLEEFSPARRAREREAARSDLGLGEEMTVLFVGNDHLRKGADVLIRGMQGTEARLLLAGQEGDPSVRSLARREGVRADFLGPRSDVPRLLAAADVLALPSRFDIFGMIVLEAMASGVPPLVSPSTGASEIVTHGEDGWIATTGDPHEVKEGLRVLSDPDRRAEMGAAARKTAEAHSLDDHVDRILRIYEAIADRKR
jgi:UDP-glucose:(heptosyl)LPS alpha-1,3-glucosyltransferase